MLAVARNLRPLPLDPSSTVEDQRSRARYSFHYDRRELVIVIDDVEHATKKRGQALCVIDAAGETICLVEERSPLDVVLLLGA